MFKAIEAMGAKLAKKEKVESLMTNDEYVAQVKIDGFRISTEKRDGKVRIFGRGSGKYDSRTEYTELLPHIVNALEHPHIGMPDDTILDGEIVFLDENGNADYNKTSNVMGSNPDRAIALQMERGWLYFQVFDILEYRGIPTTGDRLVTRDALMHDIVPKLICKHIVAVDMVCGTSAKKALLDSELVSGREGIMLKNINSIYIPGKKRENTWYKIKAEADADVIILGYTQPDEFTQTMHNGKKLVDESGNPVMSRNRYFDNRWVGSLIIGQYVKWDAMSREQVKYSIEYDTHRIQIDGVDYHLVPVGKVSSGLADEVRASISQAQEQNLMRAIEVRYFKRTDDSYYLPRFRRFRDEKPINECVWED